MFSSKNLVIVPSGIDSENEPREKIFSLFNHFVSCVVIRQALQKFFHTALLETAI